MLRLLRSVVEMTTLVSMTIVGVLASVPTSAAQIQGQVLGAGVPIANSTVTLWSAGTGEPRQLEQSQTQADGRFVLNTDTAGANLYLVAKGGHSTLDKTGESNGAIAMMTVLGGAQPTDVVVNEMTRIASVWTHAQFLAGTVIKGNVLSLRIAAGNVPDFVDLRTGGWGTAIQNPLNSNQTTTMANFATIADGLSGCITRVTADACEQLFKATTPPTGATPTDTLRAVEDIARFPWYQPERVFALLDAFYPIPPGKTLRPVPRMPYLSFAPSAWVLPLKF
jgi:hypothetical protein